LLISKQDGNNIAVSYNNNKKENKLFKTWGGGGYSEKYCLFQDTVKKNTTVYS
jgi:hypothetical protein